MMSKKSMIALMIVPMLLLGTLIVIDPVDSEPTRDNAPLLTSPSVSHDIGSPKYTFQIIYTDYDDDAPLGVHLTCDNISYRMKQVNMNITNYTRGVAFQYIKTLSKGNHTYFFNTTNQYASVRQPTTGHYNLTVVDEKGPELINQFYYPMRPDENTGVSFNVTYKDENGNPPAYVYLYLTNGSGTFKHRMTVKSGNYSNGVMCYVYLRLFRGNYSYHYWANNSKNQSVSLPESGSYGLYVAPYDPRAVLSYPRHSPSNPTDKDTIHFNITYSDPDNDPPTKIWVTVYDRDGKMVRNLSMYSPLSYPFTVSRTYGANTNLSNGTYYYWFHAVNVNETVHNPPDPVGIYPSYTKGYRLVVGSVSNLPRIESSWVSPLSPYENQTVNFTAKYIDPLGGKHLPSMVMYLKPVGGYGSNYTLTRIGNNFTTGVTYFTTVKLAAGNYTYRYYFWVYNGSFSYPSDRNLNLYISPKGIDNPPKLLNGSHSVGSGGNVSFSVTYKDADGDRPSYVYLMLSNLVMANRTYSSFTTYRMSWSGSSYTTGVKASYLITLSNGSYRYYFKTFSIGSYGNGSAVYPVDRFVYFNVSVKSQPTNSAPVLYSRSVTPARPSSGQLVNFTIYYKDADGDSPSFITLYLGGVSRNYTSYGMTTVGSSYKTGVTNYKVLNLSAGNYTYYFRTSDGNKTVTSPLTGAYTLYVASSGGSVAPPGGDISGKAALTGDPDSGIDMDVIEIEEGLTLEVTDYKDGEVSVRITSEEVKDRIISLEIQETLLGKLTEKGVVIKLDGKEMEFKSMEELLEYKGDQPYYHIDRVDGKYILTLYIPDATTHDLEASMGVDEDESKDLTPVIIIILIALVVIVIAVLGALFLTSAQRKKKQEAFYHDFDLDLEEEEEEPVVGGKLNGKRVDWDDLLE